MEGKRKIKKVGARGILVTPVMKEKIRMLRRSAHLSVQELVDKALISEKTLKKIENPSDKQIHFDEEQLTRITRALGVSIDDLEEIETQSNVDYDFEYLAKHFRDIDQKLLPIIRDHRHAPPNIVTEEYQDLLDRHLQKNNISLELLEQKFHNRRYRENFISELPKPNLVIDVSKNLDRISYICSPQKKISIKFPELFWDCHCDTPSSNSKRFKCPIHSNPLGNEVRSRFSSGYVLIKYRNLKFYWRSSQELWPPSIDSFHMFCNMEKDGLLTNKYRNIIDLGSGTGFLGILTAFYNPYVTQVVLSDWLLSPYLYGITNWLLNMKNREHISHIGKISLFTSGLGSQFKPYDVVICNPPYLPLIEGNDELGLESTVAGTDLLTDVILRSKSLGQKIYLQFSHIAKPEAKAAEEKAGVKLRPIGDEKLVPFRLRILWEKENYINLLIRKRGLIEKKNTRHPYWHLIQTYVIE